MEANITFAGKPYLCSLMNVSDDFQQRWWTLEAKLVERFGKKPDMEAILFLIGMQETGFCERKNYQRAKAGFDACSGMHRAQFQRLLPVAGAR